ncbi:MAG: DUF4301 family protein [Deltaproteobacteria bacterium]|nr:DUF4301 family protein [Deltaproteobacteria bacterium]
MFTDEDIRQIEDHGLTLEEVNRQLDIFKMPLPYLDLDRPCTAGDGIKIIDKGEMQALMETYEREAPKLGCVKFVPASGAASRMFKTLLGFLNRDKEIIRESVASEAEGGKRDAQDLLAFMDGTRRFAFFEDLKSVISRNELDIDKLLERGQFTEIILKFHGYPEVSRTAFEEHLVEAAFYVADRNRECRLHFTVSHEHLREFEGLLDKVVPVYEEKYDASFHVTFSMQKKSTDTLAVDLENMPFRQKDGKILFRPGGHGALIENLNDLEGDIIFVKNIDNVVPDRLKPDTFKWKKILGGYLIDIQSRVFSFLKELSTGTPDEAFLDRVMDYVKDELCLTVPVAKEKAPGGEKRTFLMETLNRPIRVCGMVKNVGEPGGGPFWVRDKSGGSSLQIVEMAQVDPDSKDHQKILTSSTHFNPVDLVCGVSDFKGRPFDLRKYVDPGAVFIAQKSKDGKDLKALEHPGLWNGAMARWITFFVEVPIITFNPVKTVNDLLRKEHQPG